MDVQASGEEKVLKLADRQRLRLSGLRCAWCCIRCLHPPSRLALDDSQSGQEGPTSVPFPRGGRAGSEAPGALPGQ